MAQDLADLRERGAAPEQLGPERMPEQVRPRGRGVEPSARRTIVQTAPELVKPRRGARAQMKTCRNPHGGRP
jgi:hypothetical protein